MDRDGHLQRWHLQLGQLETVAQLPNEAGEVLAADWTPDLSAIATAHPLGLVQLWDLEQQTPQLLEPLTTSAASPDGPSQALSQLQLSENGRVLLGLDARQKLHLWMVETQQQQLWPQAMAPVEAAQLSTEGDRLLTRHESDKVTLWNVETGQQLRQWQLPGLTAMALEPSGEGFAAALAGGQIRRFTAESDPHTGPSFQAALEPEDRITQLRFGPEQLIAGTAQGKLILWQRATGRVLRQLEHPANQAFVSSRSMKPSAGMSMPGPTEHSTSSAAITKISISADGNWVAAMTDLGEVAFWAATVEQLRALARDRSFRSLTEDECRVYLRLGPPSCPPEL